MPGASNMGGGTAFTPGPWSAHPVNRWVCPVADMEMPVCALRYESHGIPTDENEVRANAHLIAAAPELYGNAEFLCDRLRDLEGSDPAELERQLLGHVLPALARMEMALAKARGEA